MNRHRGNVSEKVWNIVRIIFRILFSVNAQEDIMNNNVIQPLENRSLEELIIVMTFSQIPAQWNGEYNKGN